MRSSCSELYRQEVSESEAELGPEYVLDKGAAEEMENKNQRLCNSLENELHATKASMIKEHIRLAFQRMGDFQYERGDMEAAHKAYARMKDYCTTAEHATDMCLKAALVLIDMGSFEAASIYLARGDPSGTADTQSKARLGAVSGLLLLREGRFKEAAAKLCHLPEALGVSFNTITCNYDVAIYGTLCALASLHRAGIRAELLESAISKMKPFHEAAPIARKLAQSYCSGDFKALFDGLASMRSTMLCDMYAGRHFDAIVTRIKERVAVQYFRPYETADMGRLVLDLGLPESEVSEMVGRLVADGDIPARIDAQTGTLHRLKCNERQQLMKEVLNISEAHAQEMSATVLRLSLIRQNFSVSEECEHNDNDKVFAEGRGTGDGDGGCEGDGLDSDAHRGAKARRTVRRAPRSSGSGSATVDDGCDGDGGHDDVESDSDVMGTSPESAP